MRATPILMSLFALLMITTPLHAQDDVLFKDDFDGGLNPALWNAYGDGWAVSDDGALVVGDDLLILDEEWADYAVQFDYRVTDGSDVPIEVTLREHGDGQSLNFSLSTSHVGLYLQNTETGDTQFVATAALPVPLNNGSWHPLTFIAQGNRAVVLSDGIKILDVADLEINPGGGITFYGGFDEKAIEIDNLNAQTPDPVVLDAVPLASGMTLAIADTLYLDNFETGLNTAIWQPYGNFWTTDTEGVLTVGQDWLLLPGSFNDFSAFFELRAEPTDEILIEAMIISEGDADYYVLSFSDGFVTLFRQDDDSGERTLVGSESVGVSLADDMWHTLEVATVGKRIVALVDGALVLDIEITDNPPRGDFVLNGGYEEKVVMIDNFLMVPATPQELPAD